MFAPSSQVNTNSQHSTTQHSSLHKRRGGKIAVVLSVSREKIQLYTSIGCKSANSIIQKDMFFICEQLKVKTIYIY